MVNRGGTDPGYASESAEWSARHVHRGSSSMKRILTTPLSGAQPGVRRAYERLRQAIGGARTAPDGADAQPERPTAPMPEPLPLSELPPSLLELDSRMLLRFVLQDDTDSTAIDSSFELASRFTRHGATILELQEIGDGVFVEFLLTVEQAMFILGHTPAAPAVLERWLRGAGYLEGVHDRITVLAANLRERYAPATPTPAPAPEDLPAIPLGPVPSDPRVWN